MKSDQEDIQSQNYTEKIKDLDVVTQKEPETEESKWEKDPKNFGGNMEEYPIWTESGPSYWELVNFLSVPKKKQQPRVFQQVLIDQEDTLIFVGGVKKRYPGDSCTPKSMRIAPGPDGSKEPRFDVMYMNGIKINGDLMRHREEQDVLYKVQGKNAYLTNPQPPQETLTYLDRPMISLGLPALHIKQRLLLPVGIMRSEKHNTIEHSLMQIKSLRGDVERQRMKDCCSNYTPVLYLRYREHMKCTVRILQDQQKNHTNQLEFCLTQLINGNPDFPREMMMMFGQRFFRNIFEGALAT